ncbi:hypothetical protein [Alistipes sp.]|uniref:hypothetical protein n=1 Tax=Alistipes sp. TaxID=1872444 RepID=UPI0025C4E3CF|nr:hypothetical protein [Alistipes sp.]
MKNLYFKALFCLCALCPLIAGGCDDSDSEVNEKSFAISVSQNEMAAYYKVTAPTAAEAGETVSVTVEVTSESHYLEFVSANGVACKQVAGDSRGGSFEFVMPERNVSLGIIVLELKPEEYPINAPTSKEYTVTVAKTAIAGEVVDVEIVVTNGMFAVSACLFNDTPCELVSSGTVSWKYRFTMPAEEVTLTVATDLDRHLITLKKGEHTSLRMLNCCDDWEAVPPVFSECMYGAVKFMWSADLGYDGQLKITGQTTGADIEYMYRTDDPDMGKCWFCVMPDEPILIETSAVEKTDYVGKQFVGAYKGFQLTASESQVIRGSSSEFTMELKSNTSYFVKSTDANHFDFDGCYRFDDAKNFFEYLIEFSDNGYGEKDFGASGNWFANGDAFVYINDLIDDKPEKVKYYFTSTADFEFVSAASDSYGSRYLVELDKAGTKSWYYIERATRAAQQVELDFKKGTSIGEDSEAIVSDKTAALFRYSYDSAKKTPVFTPRGKEAGTYKPASGSGPELTLDGFGEAVYGEKEGTYTLRGTVVTFVSGADRSEFAIDLQKLTYSMVSSGGWEGPKEFSVSLDTESGIAIFNNKPTRGSVMVRLDSDFRGNEKKGYAKFKATVYDSDWFQDKNVTDESRVYTYDPTSRILLISQVLVGTADGRGTVRTDLRLRVSEDQKTLTFEEDTLLRAISGGDRTYIKLKGLKLTAE